MSLFSNDMRVANTAAPSFQSQANVGQYGWTGADQGHYNQLLQYVDECRKIWLNLEEKILYVEGILVDVENIGDQVKYVEIMTNEVQKWRQEVLTSRDLVNSMYNQLIPLIDDFNPKYIDFTKKYEEVVQIRLEVLEANQEAHEAASKAEIARDEARDIAEELRKGQVYRGTWNIQANAKYPDAPDTNSVWDIVLNEGALEYRFDNTTWYWGDRLLYLKDDNAFTQIEAGGSVTSVNGKKGAVTLTPEDVGSLPISGGYLTGRAFVDMGAGAEPQIGVRRDGRILFMADNNTVQGMYSTAVPGQSPSWLSYRDIASGVIYLGDSRSPTVVNGKDETFTYKGKKVYHEGFKPTYTAADVGAASSNSPRITGAMSIYAGNSHIRLIENDQTPEKVWHMEVSAGNFRLVETNVKSHIDIIAGGAMVIGSPTGVKGTLQVGPSATGSNLGSTTIRNQMTSLIEVISPADTEHKAGSGIVFHNASSGTAGLVYKQNGANDSYFNFISDETRWDVRINGKKVYHEGLLPTASQVGAIPTTDVTTSGERGKIPKISSGGVLEVGQHLDFHFEDHSRDYDARLHVAKNSDGTTYTLNSVGNFNAARQLFENGKRVYSEGYRPQPVDIGAVSLTQANIAPRFGTNFTAGSEIWIAANFKQQNAADSVVVGSIQDGATIGGHSSTFDSWKPLYVNSHAGMSSNNEHAHVVLCNPHRQLVVDSGAGVPAAIQYPLVMKGRRVGNPSWWLAPHSLRFMDGHDLMLAATNGVRQDPDWAYLQKFKFTVRLSVNAPANNVWTHKYGFDVFHYQPTNSSDTFDIPFQFDCHAGAGTRGKIVKQMVPGTENQGMPYFELHMDPGYPIQHAPDLYIQLEVIAENLFE